MQELQKQITNAQEELQNTINIPCDTELLLEEIIEMKELENQLRQYIKQGKEILKQNIKKNE